MSSSSWLPHGRLSTPCDQCESFRLFHVLDQVGYGEVMTSANSEAWAPIRDAAFEVIMLTQRGNDLWSLPTISDELGDDWSLPASPESVIRSREAFGHSSITVSFNALTALAAVTNEKHPRSTHATLAAIDTRRGLHGGYGSPSERMHNDTVNAVPRHTAMAAVAHLVFSEAVDLSVHLQPAIKWLLDAKMKSGGWPYDWSRQPLRLGSQSTASAICALCLYSELSGAPREIVRRSSSAVSKAYAGLLRCERDGVWQGKDDGVPERFEVRDAAFVIRLLRLADRSGTLSRMIADSVETVEILVERLGRRLMPGGWPATLDSTVPDIIATIPILHLMGETGHRAYLDEDCVRSAERSILAGWRNGELAARMTAWDWQCIALLATERAGPMSATGIRKANERLVSVRRAWLSGTLGAGHLARIGVATRECLTFALTEGRGLPTRSMWKRLATGIRRLGNLTFENLWAMVIGLVVLLLSYYVIGQDLSDFLRNLVSDE